MQGQTEKDLVFLVHPTCLKSTRGKVLNSALSLFLVVRSRAERNKLLTRLCSRALHCLHHWLLLSNYFIFSQRRVEQVGRYVYIH